ncbi:MAG: hypothetical protein CMK59_03930 [Proteobacteria bacterium]|nr:hypothetical protein [Pseudomonadota bacterium]
MQDLHSSSALCINVFDYWRSQTSKDPSIWPILAKALKIPSQNLSILSFEAKLSHAASGKKAFPRKPNLDALIEYKGHQNIDAFGIESKFTEASYDKPSGLKSAYVDEPIF